MTHLADVFSHHQIVFCPYEEAKLMGLFGDEFARYRRRVRRWL